LQRRRMTAHRHGNKKANIAGRHAAPEIPLPQFRDAGTIAAPGPERKKQVITVLI
jgi:hypothetical protein